MKKLIVIRHCSATGQERDAELTNVGREQANSLATFLLENHLQINHIISSPLESTFTNIDIAFSGGESTKQATDRAISLIQDILKLEHDTTLLVTHGNLLTLILRHFDPSIGFHEWKTLTNPDIYEITLNEQSTIKRLWDVPSK